jgi:protein CMS1
LHACAVVEDAFAKPPQNKEEWTIDDISNIISSLDERITDPVDVTKEKNGSPRFLILCRAALRAIEVMKAIVKGLPKHVRVANLFAKHKRVEEQTEYLQKTVTRIALGTPNRIQKLVEDGSLKLDDLQYVVLDMGKDVKTMTILDLKSTREEFFALYHACLKERVLSHASKILMV